MKWMQFLTPVKALDFEETEAYISQHPVAIFPSIL